MDEKAMADGEELTEAALERQLQEHLEEQRVTLVALDQALASDPANQELQAVHGELCVAITGAEESLLQLKRTRLLHEVEDILDASHNAKKSILEEPSAGSCIIPQEDCNFSLVGSKYRFMYSDGRWYNGQVIEVNDEELVRLSFLHPTTEKMQMCKFYMQQRCRFGGNCRMSHGFLVPPDALREFTPQKFQQATIGSAVLACDPAEAQGLWRQAELQSWDEVTQRGSVIFVNDGSRIEVGMDNLYIAEFGEGSDDEDTDFSEDGNDDLGDVDDADDFDGLSFGGVTSQSGPQTETRIFAHWERHTRGVASKMMANMGYREGTGLGRSGQGIVAPLQVRVLPKHQSLDFIGDALAKGEGSSKGTGKKKSRGGKRKRDKKLAEASRAAKAKEDTAPDVFGFINSQLAAQGSVVSEERSTKMSTKGKGKVVKVDRRLLIAQADEVVELRTKVEKLEEMAARNRKEKAIYDAVCRKLDESRKALLKAEADHTSASLAVHSKEREKKWLRF